MKKKDIKVAKMQIREERTVGRRESDEKGRNAQKKNGKREYITCWT